MYQIKDILNTVICGDILEELAKFPDECVDMVITSPPYFGLRRYLDDNHLNKKHEIGLEKSFDEFLKKILGITAEIKRILKPSGSFWLNFGDIYGTGSHAGSRQGTKQGTNRGSNYYEDVGKPKIAGYEKSLLMMPERIAIKMCDEQGYILRNKICWAKQVLHFKDMRTYGSVMPTSIRDRFNQSYEDLYFFVKNKKYYSDLDAVRLPVQTIEDRDFGIDREKDYPNAKRNKFAFNYRVRDAKRKEGQPQFKASEEEIKNYKREKRLIELPQSAYSGGTNAQRLASFRSEQRGKYQGKFVEKEDAELFNSPRARTQRKQDNVPGRNAAMYKGFNARWKETQKVKYDISERQAELVKGGAIGSTQRLRGFFDEFGGENNPAGKNLPSVWLINPQPHNFEREFALEGIDHFATFPEKLCEVPIKFSCPPNGIVLDPFCGSGTALVVAKKLGRNFIGIELSEKYVKIANMRLTAQPEPML